MIWLWAYLIAAVSAGFGFMLCGILTAGKTADQEAEVWHHRIRASGYKDHLIRLGHEHLVDE